VPSRLLLIVITLGGPLAQRVFHTCKAVAQNMGVNLPGAYIGMPQQGLYGANITAALKPFGGEKCSNCPAYLMRIGAPRV
jgi:hypothetical protein